MKLGANEARAVIDAAIEGGVNFADTARGYGSSEEKLGDALKGRRSDFILASKSPLRASQGMRKAIEQSLRNFQTDYIDIYQVHSLHPGELAHILAPGGAMEALQAAKAAGKIRFIGVTGHRPPVLVDALKTGKFDTVQAPINVVDRESEDELLPLAKKMDIGILAMKPICGGTLDNPGLGIRFSLNSLTDLVLCGMKNVLEVKANLETVRTFKPLSEAELDQLLEEASQLGQQFCRRCEYCQPCPEGLPIPRILWLANYHARGNRWTEQEYKSMEINAKDCEECGDCEEKCPYDLPIREMLKLADRELTPSTKVLAKRKVRKLLDRHILGRKTI